MNRQHNMCERSEAVRTAGRRGGGGERSHGMVVELLQKCGGAFVEADLRDVDANRLAGKAEAGEGVVDALELHGRSESDG